MAAMKFLHCIVFELMLLAVAIAKDNSCFDVEKSGKLRRAARQQDCGVSKVLENQVTKRVMGGVNAELGEFPWMARLFYRSKNVTKARCGGSIIHEKYVLTAAHCCKGDFSMELLFVRLGDYDALTDEDCHRGRCAPKHKDIGVKSIISHDEFETNLMKNDICLLELEKKIEFSDYIYPICLPVDCEMQENSFNHKSLIAAGWGLKDDVRDRQIDIIQKVKLSTLPTKTCAKKWAQESLFDDLTQIDDSQICAGRQVGKDVCGGDSGGPLMYKSSVTGHSRNYVVGLVSYGQPCSHRFNEIVPGVYTRVSSFLPWIFDVITTPSQ